MPDWLSGRPGPMSSPSHAPIVPNLPILLPGIGARGGDLKAIRSMELWAERVVPMVEQALGMSIDEIEGAPPWPSTP